MLNLGFSIQSSGNTFPGLQLHKVRLVVLTVKVFRQCFKEKKKPYIGHKMIPIKRPNICSFFYKTLPTSNATVLWPQQKVQWSCWSSMFNGIGPEPTNKRFTSAYLEIQFLIFRKIHCNTFWLDETFSCWSQVTMMF